jgi:hypothetical protein
LHTEIAKREAEDRPRGERSGQRAQTGKSLLLERDHLCGRLITRLRQAQVQGQDACRVEARIDFDQLQKAADQQACTHQNDQRQSHLACDQRTLKPSMLRADNG